MVFCMTHHCNSAPRVSGTSAGGVWVPLFPLSGFGFLYLAVLQSFYWYLISRNKSCIVTQCYAIVQWLFEIMADLEAHVSKLLSAFHF